MKQNSSPTGPKPEVERNISAVAPPPAKNIAIIVIAIVFSIFAFYQLFFKSDPNAKKEKDLPPIDLSSTTPVNKPEDTIINIAPPLPDPGPISVPVTPPPIEVPTIAPQIGLAPPPPPGQFLPKTVSKDDPYITRKRSVMFLENTGGRNGKGVTGEDGKTAISEEIKPYRGGDYNSQSAIAHTSFTQAKATDIGDTKYLIAQGKMIDAVLETAINTDHVGLLRAIVNHDIYAESGKAILVPKGSRLIGNYSADIKRGDSRVYVIWDRIIRPDGIDINVSSPGTDTLGRAGLDGLVDSKYLELFGNALLISTITAGFGYTAQKAAQKADSNNNSGTAGVITTTTLPNGSTQQSGSLSDLAAQQAIQNFQSTTQSIYQDFLKVTPTIMVNQGTKIKVFVKKDLLFPKNIVSGLHRIP